MMFGVGLIDVVILDCLWIVCGLFVDCLGLGGFAGPAQAHSPSVKNYEGKTPVGVFAVLQHRMTREGQVQWPAPPRRSVLPDRRPRPSR